MGFTIGTVAWLLYFSRTRPAALASSDSRAFSIGIRYSFPLGGSSVTRIFTRTVPRQVGMSCFLSA